MEMTTVKVNNPDNLNMIIGQSHFIKTVEDIHEMMVNNVPGAQFGLAFCEASGERLIRHTGTNEELVRLAVENAEALACGHLFIMFMKDMFPINILPALKMVPEVCRIFCATANPVEAIICETSQGRGLMGVVDGYSPAGTEKSDGRKWRIEFLRKIGYKCQ